MAIPPKLKSLDILAIDIMKENKKLNFGCGKIIKPKEEGWINVDIQKAKGIDKSFNFDKFPYPFEDDEFDYIFADNVFEHLENPLKAVGELKRISKSGGVIEIIVPHYKSLWAWGDLTHKNFFSEKSIKQLFKDKVYVHKKDKAFEIKKIKLKSSKPFNYFPKIIRDFLNRFLSNVYSEINIRVKVLKWRTQIKATKYSL